MHSQLARDSSHQHSSWVSLTNKSFPCMRGAFCSSDADRCGIKGRVCPKVGCNEIVSKTNIKQENLSRDLIFTIGYLMCFIFLFGLLPDASYAKTLNTMKC